MFNIRKNNHFYEKVGKKGEEVCIDEEIPWDIPETWELVRLNHLGVSTSGKTPKANELFDEGKYPYFKVGDMNTLGNELFLQFTEKYLSDDYTGKLFAQNSIVYPKNGGAVFTNKKRILKYESVVDLNTGVFTPYSCLDLKFMYWMFNSIDFNKYYKGTALPTVDKKRMDNLFFGLPPLKEQKRIVKKIEELLPLINQYDGFEEELNKLNNDFPNKIKDSILQEAIQGKLVHQDGSDEPACVLLERIKEEKEHLIKEKKIKRNKNESFIFKENNHFYEKIGKNEPNCIDEEIPFNIPNSWQWCRLGDLVYNFGQKKPDQTFSYVDVGSIDNKNLKLNDEETILTKEEAPSRARKIIKEGSVIYSTVRPYLLNMCIIDKEFSYEPIASTAFAILNPFEGLYNKYLFYYLQSPTFINYVNGVMSGVAYPAINDKKLYNSLIALPPFEEQKQIVKKIEKIIKY